MSCDFGRIFPSSKAAEQQMSESIYFFTLHNFTAVPKRSVSCFKFYLCVPFVLVMENYVQFNFRGFTHL